MSIYLQDKQIESTLADIRSELSFVELAILHELVYNDIDEETRKKKENDMAKHAEKAVKRLSTYDWRSVFALNFILFIPAVISFVLTPAIAFFEVEKFS